MNTLDNFLLDWGSTDSNRLLFFLFISFLLGIFGGFILWGMKLQNAESSLDEKNSIVKELSSKVEELKALVRVSQEQYQSAMERKQEKNPNSATAVPDPEEKASKPTRLVIEKPKKQPAAKAQQTVEQLPAEDDLKKIVGISAKIETLLHAAGILTYRQLSETGTDRLQEILEPTVKNYQKRNPASWSLQAALAHEGNWDELAKLQSQLMKDKG